MAKSRVAIIGLGRIGGSLGLALKQAKLDVEIVGHDKNTGVAGRALKRGAVDKTEWNLINACDGAGLIILALPLDGIKDTLAVLKSELQPGVIVTDTASSKVPVLEWANELAAGVQFIGGNPVLKSEHAANARGIDAADPALFQGATYCLISSHSASNGALETVSNLAAILGAKPYFIDAAEHDGLMAGVQHLPALLATTLAGALMTSSGWRELGKVAGADLSAATELVPTDSASAREEFFAHRTDLIRWIDVLSAELGTMRDTLERQDEAAIKSLIETIATERNRWLNDQLGSEPAPSVDWQSLQNNTARLFLGGLADRARKRK